MKKNKNFFFFTSSRSSPETGSEWSGPPEIGMRAERSSSWEGLVTKAQKRLYKYHERQGHYSTSYTQHLPCINQRIKPQILRRPISPLCCTRSPKWEQLRLSSNINVPMKWWSMVSCLAEKISQCPGHHLLSTLQNPHFTHRLSLSLGFLSITFFLCGWPHLILHRERKKLQDTSRASKRWPELPSSFLPVSMTQGGGALWRWSPWSLHCPLQGHCYHAWYALGLSLLISSYHQRFLSFQKQMKRTANFKGDASDLYSVMMSIYFCLPSWSLNLLRT